MDRKKKCIARGQKDTSNWAASETAWEKERGKNEGMWSGQKQTEAFWMQQKEFSVYFISIKLRGMWPAMVGDLKRSVASPKLIQFINSETA